MGFFYGINYLLLWFYCYIYNKRNVMTVKQQVGKWTDEENKILIDFYPKHGGRFCLKLLPNRKIKSIYMKTIRLGLKRVENYRYKCDYFSKVVKDSINYTDICRNLKLSTTMGNRNTIKKYIKKYNLDISHFKNGVPKNSKKIELIDILVVNSTYTHTTNLKNKLYKENLKKRECELCGQNEEWKGNKMSLILDHKNGVNNDNRLENLRIVCPNCNATLDTHGGKNINNKE